MATTYSSSALLLATIFLYLRLTCSDHNKSSSSSTIALAQMKFWSQNVVHQMPNPILNKLSPLSQKDTDYFTNSISRDNPFSASHSFCSLAKLACQSEFKTVTPLDDGYNTYGRTVRPLDDGYNTYGRDTPFSHKSKANADPFSFFRVSVLKKGNLVHLPNLLQYLPNRAFLPPQIASKIPISSMSDIAKIFPESVVNGAAKETIETALSYCNAEAIKGEIKSCPKSLEEMVSFTKLALGAKKLISLSSKTMGVSNPQMVIKSIQKFKRDKIVECHEIFLPFATYFCHSLSSTNLYAVDVEEPKSNASTSRLIAICHFDTSPWPADHVAFQILKFKPGQGEACHWFTQIDLAWINADGESV